MPRRISRRRRTIWKPPLGKLRDLFQGGHRGARGASRGGGGPYGSGRPESRPRVCKSANSRTGGRDRRANHAIRRRPLQALMGLKASPTAMAEVAPSVFADSRARPSSARDFGQALGNDDARGSLGSEGEVGRRPAGSCRGGGRFRRRTPRRTVQAGDTTLVSRSIRSLARSSRRRWPAPRRPKEQMTKVPSSLPDSPSSVCSVR